MKNSSLLALMHDTAHDLNNIKSLVILLEKEIVKLNPTPEQNTQINFFTTNIAKCSQNCMDTLDVYYLKQKES